MNRRRSLLSIALLMLFILLLAGCANSSVKILWFDAQGSNWYRASYETFSGVERQDVRLESDQTLSLQHDVNVNKGALSVQVQNPDGDAAWETSFRETQRLNVEVPLRQSGIYHIVIKGDNTGGSFDISWKVE